MSGIIKTPNGAITWANVGGGTSFETGNELNLENDILSYKANFGTTSEFETFKQDESVPVGATYHVTDDFVDGGGNVYDDQERVIGTWFGKPLYRKVYTLTNAYTIPNNVWTEIEDVDARNINRVIKCSYVWINNADASVMVHYPLICSNNRSAFNNHIAVMNTRASGSIGFVGDLLILEYTKVGD